MAKKKADEAQNPAESPSIEEGLSEESAAEPQSEPSSAAGPPITDYVVIVNLTKQALQPALRNGKTVNLGPRVPGQKINRSEPILRRLLTPEIDLLKRKGMLALEPAGGV